MEEACRLHTAGFFFSCFELISRAAFPTWSKPDFVTYGNGAGSGQGRAPWHLAGEIRAAMHGAGCAHKARCRLLKAPFLHDFGAKSASNRWSEL
ncbi:hypothetical protein ATU3C_17795 [Agrobacterium genomosp. 3 str. RTP8]|nr:hypothetical protein [Agrobacterium tomkonis RTP8]